MVKDNSSIRFEWVVAESLATSSVAHLAASEIDISQTVLQPLTADRLPDTEDPGFEPLTMIVGTAAIAYLAKAASRNCAKPSSRWGRRRRASGFAGDKRRSTWNRLWNRCGSWSQWSTGVQCTGRSRLAASARIQMNGRLNRVSLVIEIDAPYRPPDPRYVLNPAGFEPEMSRVLIHEGTHYWQQLSQMYLLLVAAEEWERLNRFRFDGQVVGPGPLTTALRNLHTVIGFSAHDLSESACRYWDVLNIGPHNLVEAELAKGTDLDGETRDFYEAAIGAGLFRGSDDAFTQYTIALAMRVVAGSYSRPYVYLQDKLGGGAMVLFPLLAHWALQTPAPVTLFEKFAEHAGRKLDKWLRRDSFLQRVTHHTLFPGELRELQMMLYWMLGGEIAKLAKKEGFVLWTVGQFFEFTPLSTHPVYAWAARWARKLGQHVVDSGMAIDMRAGFRRDPDSLALLAADRLLALPGGGSARELLYTYLGPPIHRFSDDRTWLTRVGPNDADNAAVAQACMQIHTSWEAFRSAARGY
jgi:hypothetical protein